MNALSGVILSAGSIVLTAALSTACADPAPPTGTGNKVLVDVDADNSPPPPPPPDDAGYDSPFADPDGFGYGTPDGYAPNDVCKKCNCDPTISFCFGGGTGLTTFGGSCAINVSGTLSVGCNALPSACKASPSCTCLIDQVAKTEHCYLVCGESGDVGYAVYCPVP
jgi:hypothetical protein